MAKFDRGKTNTSVQMVDVSKRNGDVSSKSYFDAFLKKNDDYSSKKNVSTDNTRINKQVTSNVSESDTGLPLIRDRNPNPFNFTNRSGKPFVIDSITINMKEWSKDNRTKPGYAARVYDGSGDIHMFVVSGIELESAKLLFDELRAKNIVLSGTTDVEILAPKEMLCDKSVGFGVHSRCNIKDLRKYGMDALDFYPTDKYGAEKRLSSVLHLVTSYSISAGIETNPLKSLFEYSEYDEPSGP